MRKEFTVVVAMIFFGLAGCATSYHVRGLTGGFDDTQLAPDVFRVVFSGNGYTSGERAQDFAMLRAADLTLQHGFKYFALINENDSTTEQSFTTTGHANTTGEVYAYGNNATYSSNTTYTPGQTYTFHKPKSGLMIRCFATKPEGISVFDAAFLRQSLGSKYGILFDENEAQPSDSPTKPENNNTSNMMKEYQ